MPEVLLQNKLIPYFLSSKASVSNPNSGIEIHKTTIEQNLSVVVKNSNSFFLDTWVVKGTIKISLFHLYKLFFSSLRNSCPCWTKHTTFSLSTIRAKGCGSRISLQAAPLLCNQHHRSVRQPLPSNRDRLDTERTWWREAFYRTSSKTSGQKVSWLMLKPKLQNRNTIADGLNLYGSKRGGDIHLWLKLTAYIFYVTPSPWGLIAYYSIAWTWVGYMSTDRQFVALSRIISTFHY